MKRKEYEELCRMNQGYEQVRRSLKRWLGIRPCTLRRSAGSRSWRRKTAPPQILIH
jgi:hypothetical protein